MILFLCGSIYGQLTRLYDNVLSVESRIGSKADWVLQTGNFGAFPDPDRIPRRFKNKSNDFYQFYLGEKQAPRRTLFVAGGYEDHQWLAYTKNKLTVAPNIVWLMNGYTTLIEDMTVLGLGKTYSPRLYEGKKVSKDKKVSHYTRQDVQRACSAGPVNLVLAHQAPAKCQFGPITSQSRGLSNVVYATRPDFYVHGSYNISREYEIGCASALSLKDFEVKAFSWDGTYLCSIV